MRSKLAKALLEVVGYLSIIAVLVSVFLYCVLGDSGTDDSLQLLVRMVTLLAIFVISNALKSKLFCDKIDITLDNQSKNLKVIVNEMSSIKVDAHIRGLNDQTDFYNLLQQKVNNSVERVWLMHLDPFRPDAKTISDKARVAHFDNLVNFAKNNPKVDIRRIISIPDYEKLKWVNELIEKTANIRNIHFAYIKIDEIEKSFPVTVISCQIIDNNMMFLLNPTLNYVPGGTFKECLYIENTKMVNIYKEYYEKLWDKLKEDDCQHIGCLIKDGSNCEHFKKHLATIEDNIKKYENRSRETAHSAHA